MNRSRELERLTREVEAKFRALPNCPKGLVVELQAIGNIRVAYGDRHHVFNPLFVDTAMHREGWAADVLAQVLGAGGLRVAEMGRRAAIVAALRPAQVAFLMQVQAAGIVFLLDRSKIALAVDLEQKGLLVSRRARSELGERPEVDVYEVTEFGFTAIGAFNV